MVGHTITTVTIQVSTPNRSIPRISTIDNLIQWQEAYRRSGPD